MEKQTPKKSLKEIATNLLYSTLGKLGVYCLNTPEKRDNFKIIYSKRLETNSKGELVDRFYVAGLANNSSSLKEIVKDRIYISA